MTGTRRRGTRGRVGRRSPDCPYERRRLVERHDEVNTRRHRSGPAGGRRQEPVGRRDHGAGARRPGRGGGSDTGGDPEGDRAVACPRALITGRGGRRGRQRQPLQPLDNHGSFFFAPNVNYRSERQMFTRTATASRSTNDWNERRMRDKKGTALGCWVLAGMLT